MTELSHGQEPHQAALIQDEILEILKEAKVLARRFYRQTGEPLGVTWLWLAKLMSPIRHIIHRF
jgi:hypothetical protein